MRDNRAAIEYAKGQLLARAGVAGSAWPLDVGYGDVPEPADGPRLVVRAAPRRAGHAFLQQAPASVHWIPAAEAAPPGARPPFSDALPVLFWGEGAEDGGKPFAELRPDGTVVFHADIIAAAFFMLSRWEETVVPVRDEHGRFPGTASVAYKQGFLDRPVVDEYALLLRAWLQVLLPGWQPQPRPFSAELSHDVDQVRGFPSLRAAVRTFGGDLIKRRSPGQAWRTAVEAAVQTVTPERTPFFRGIETLARLSCKYGFCHDVFFFMTAGAGPSESDYDADSPAIRRCIKALQAQGFEIGLHAGYGTLNDPERLAEEKARLDGILGLTDYGGRQHYLRFQAPDTWRHWEQVGLVYDSTLTYADHEGFRCGTCHPFKPFDVGQNRELNVWERPLIVMDQTLRQYRQLTPAQGEERILELARRCQQVEGTFTLLWHNTSLDRVWRPWVAVYKRVLKALAGMSRASE